MNCWSCKKEIPNEAKFCPHCEAGVTAEITAEERAAAEGVLQAMSPDMLNELRDALDKSTSGEDFANRIMVGDCPQCGSSNTSDCENDPEIDDPCVGRCLDCGQLWCLDCGEYFKDAQSTEHDCSFWEDMGFEEEEDDDDFDEP